MVSMTRFAAACAALFAEMALAHAADAPLDAMPLPLARDVANKTTELVETHGLYPRRQAEYAQARTALLAAVDGHAPDVRRAELYARIRELLATLDADGHSFIVPSAGPTSDHVDKAADSALAPTFSLLTTPNGTVLHWVPPASHAGSPQEIAGEVTHFYDEAAARPDIRTACALVVDLSEQTGGNAWPPFIAMYPLFSDTNQGRWVDRDGKSTPFVSRASLETDAQSQAGGRSNPLAPFGAGGPLAVVVGPRTASAGEMLLVALLGEARVQTFGHTSYGLSTVNDTYMLSDGTLLMLTEMRYALGDGPVYRGGIPAMHPAPAGEPVAVSVEAAAQWAAVHSPLCAVKADLTPASPAPPARTPSTPPHRPP